MVSVENFYWVLYENLLKPTGLDIYYYYPFGTRENLSHKVEFGQVYMPRQQHHAFFHFDQEPMWNSDFGSLYDARGEAWSWQLVRILANSEHSELKRKVCQDRAMLDWYFFYHGFASLSWFWDSQYIVDQTEISSKYLSLNHLVRHKRSYRISLLAHLSQRNIINQGQISLHTTKDQILEEVQSEMTQLSGPSRSLISREINRLPEMPIILDCSDPNGMMSAKFGHQEYKMWQRSFLHVVNETVFYDRKLHLTEKIFKPIVSLRPFVLVAAPGNLEYLRSYGFKTFSEWIDESYDLEQDDDLRLEMIANEIAKLCALPLSALTEMHEEMMAVLHHNKNHFFGRFRDIIIDELVGNFDSCIRIWNNGRVDARQKSLVPNLDQVKDRLRR